jgi:hypothetical protein
MIQKILIDKVSKMVIKLVAKQFKLQKLINYMDQPNDCDMRVSNLEEEVKKLKKDSHPIQKFVCTTCNTVAMAEDEDVSSFADKLKQIKEN